MTEPALPADLQRLKFEADIATAQANATKAAAEADKARADAVKAEADADKARADAHKADADAGAAVTAAQKSADELASARTTRAANDAKSIAEAEKATIEARAAKGAALVPDVGAVAEASTLTGADTASLWGGDLVYTALTRAARALGAEIAGMLTPPAAGARARVLVVSDVDIATLDANAVEVDRALDQLGEATGALLAVIAKLAEDDGVDTQGLDPVSVAGALAKALPGILSLFSARRSIRSGTTDIGDLEAAAAVIGALRHTSVDLYHEDFRLTPKTVLHAKVDALEANRQKLSTARLGLTELRTSAEAEIAKLTPELAAAVAQAKKNPDDIDVRGRVSDLRRSLAGHTSASRSASEQITAIDTIVTAVDGYLGAARATPAGAKRSPLADAALYSVLHPTDAAADPAWTPAVTHVLLVKAHAADARQTMQNRALWFADRFSVTVEAAVTYMVLRTADSQVVSAGTTVGSVKAWGTIGKQIETDTD